MNFWSLEFARYHFESLELLNIEKVCPFVIQPMLSRMEIEDDDGLGFRNSKRSSWMKGRLILSSKWVLCELLLSHILEPLFTGSSTC